MKKILAIVLLTNIANAADFTVQFSPEDNSISTVKIQDGAVTASKIAPLSIDDSKVSSISSSKISDINSKISEFVPVGTIMDFGGENCPAGYLKNDGSSISRTAYSDLFNVIGTSYGALDSFNFNLPKYDWMIDGNIGGTNPNLSLANISSYLDIDGNLDLVINSIKGSSSAEIACTNGTNSSGLICPGAETVGIAFYPLSKGTYEACFSVAPNVYGSGGANITFQLMETPNNSNAILQEGGDRVAKAYVVGSADAVPSSNVCGVFKFNDINKKTIRLMREQRMAGSPSGHVLLAERDANLGNRDIKVTVRPLFKIGKCIKY